MSKSNFYTVWVGRNPGVYSSWDECKEQVTGFENAVYKAFPTYKAAQKAFEDDSENYIGIKQPTLNTEQLQAIGSPRPNSLCVDGACSGKTSVMEYQGVMFPSKQKVFKGGPFKTGTNNIAEFLSIVHAMTICKHRPEITAIYSDSKIAIKWIEDKKANTHISSNEDSAYILQLVERAERWLHYNTSEVPLLKWETAAWGENPADFGRK